MSQCGPDAAEGRIAHLIAAVREAGGKVTHQRLEILREVATTTEHPDADTVFRAVQQRTPTVSLDTVYRTLWMLHDLGLVTTLGPRREGVRFDANLKAHHHYICVGCGLVRDFESEQFDSIPVPKSAKQFGSILNAQVQVRGLCAGCQKLSETKPADSGKPKHKRSTP